MPEGDRVGSAYVDIHVNAAPGEAELAAFKAKVDRDFAELGRKKAEAELKLKSTQFDRDIEDKKAKLDYFKGRRATATLDLAKKHFDEQIAAAEAELKALTGKKRTIQIDSSQVRAAHQAERLLTKERALSERAAIQQSKVERSLANEREKAVTRTFKERAELAKLGAEYEKLRGRQIGLEKSSRRVFSARSLAVADNEARKLERVASQADYVKHKIEGLGGSVEHLDPQLQRNTGIIDRWLSRIGDTSVRIGPISTSFKGLAAGLGLLGPLVFELGGGLTALAGTIGEGLVGAATVGAGALAGLATSAAGVGFIVGPMIGEFKEVTAASTALHKAVLKYGKGSEQVKTAQERLNNELHGVSPIAKEAFQSLGGLKDRWRGLTKEARPAVFEAMGQGIKTAQALLPAFASESVKTTQVAAKAWDGWMKSLRSSEAKGLLKSIMGDFRASIPGLADGLGSLVAMLGRVSAAGAHFLPGLSNGFADWANNLEHAVGGGQKLQSSVGGMVSQMRDLGHLTQDTGSLLVHIFDAGASSGQGMVKSLDHVISRWDKWTQSASGKSGLKEFFGDSKQATEDFMSSLAHMTKLLFEFSRATAPVANGLLQIVTWIGDLVSAADGLVGVKQIFQGIGLTLAGLFVASKVMGFADAIGAVTTRLAAMVGIETAAAAATEAEAVAATEAAAALELQAVAAAEADATLGLGLAEGAAGAGAAMEGTAASAGLLAAALTPEVLIPAAVIAGFGALIIATNESSRSIVDMETDFRKAGHEINNSLDSSSTAIDKFIGAQHKNAQATHDVSAARKALIKLQHENAPANKVTKAVEALTEAERAQVKAAHRTGVVNKEQVDTQKHLAASVEKRVKSGREVVSALRQQVKTEQRFAGPGGGTRLAQDREKLAAAERHLAGAVRDLSRARKDEAATAVPLERAERKQQAITVETEHALRKLSGTIGATATRKIGKLVDPEDVRRVTQLGNKLTDLGRGGQVKNIAVKSQGADQTIGKLRQLQKQTNNVETARATIKVGANDTAAQSKLKRLGALSQRLTGSHNTIKILANSSSADQAIARIQRHVESVAHKQYKLELTGLDRSGPASASAYHHAREAASKKYQLTIDALDKASAPAKKAEGAGKKAAGGKYQAKITATNAQAMNSINQVNVALNALNGATAKAVLTTEHVTINRTENKGGGGHYAGGPSVYVAPFAVGGPSEDALQRAADKAVLVPGGMSRKVSKPTMLTGEEGPGHPEYVIATNPAYAAANERYLESAASDLGKEVVPAYKEGKGKKKGGSKGGGGETPEQKRRKTLANHPPKPKHHPHKIAKVEKWGPVAAYNAAETDAGIKEELYGQLFAHDEAEISAGRMDQWEFARLRGLLSDQMHDYQKLGNLVPDIKHTVDGELGRIHKLVDGKGEFSKTAIGNLNHREGVEKAKLSKLKKGKNESDSSFRKRKRPLEHAVTQIKKEKEKAEKERARLIAIRAEAKQELSEVQGAQKINEAKTNAERSADELQYIDDVQSGVIEAPYAEAESETPEMEYAKAELVRAEVAHDVAAEEAARKHMIEVAEREYNTALSTPSPKDDIEKGEQLKQLREEGASGGKATIGEQTASLSEARQQLYEQFASNITDIAPTAAPGVPPIGASGGSPSYAPGGISAMGMATPSLRTGAGGGNGTVNNVTNNFAAPPPDPHTWTKQQQFELGALA